MKFGPLYFLSGAKSMAIMNGTEPSCVFRFWVEPVGNRPGFLDYYQLGPGSSPNDNEVFS